MRAALVVDGLADGLDSLLAAIGGLPVGLQVDLETLAGLSRHTIHRRQATQARQEVCVVLAGLMERDLNPLVRRATGVRGFTDGGHILHQSSRQQNQQGASLAYYIVHSYTTLYRSE